MTTFSRTLEQHDPVFFHTSPGRDANPSRDTTFWRIAIDTLSVSQ